jgi:ParB family chromosome partitioning protein
MIAVPTAWVSDRQTSDHMIAFSVKILFRTLRRAARLLELDDAVGEVVAKLKARGLTSPYLKAFVVARINPTRFSKASSFDFDEVLGKMIASAKRFNVDKIKQEE